MRFISLFAVMALSACVSTTTQQPQPAKPQTTTPKQEPFKTKVTKSDIARFNAVIARMEPSVERECSARAKPGTNCDFKVIIDKRASKSPNAFYTLDRSGQPIMGFNNSLIANVRNADELAFVVGHEAAHHIGDHLNRSRNNAVAGAIIGGLIVGALGGGSAGVDAAVDIGGGLGGRSYSKTFELEADRLGTILTHNAGYDPVKGAAFFNKIPDPGDRFLGTHPPNAKRIEAVKQTAAKL